MVNALLNANPVGYALVEAHVWDDYTSPISETRLGTFYGSNWVPTMVTDGVIEYTDTQIDLWDDAIAARRLVPTDVTIEQWAVATGSQVYDVTAEVCVEAGGSGKTVDVLTAQVLDHHPTSYTWYRNCLMQWGITQQLTLAPGECGQVTSTFNLDATSWTHQGDIRIVAWAQTPATGFPAEVHQADTMAWPFNDPPGGDGVFADDFESGDLSYWSSVTS